jgi:putative Holliday junction resolvase
MPLVELNDLTTNFRPRQRILGLDVGTKTIGLALSDFTFFIASPLETIKRGKFTKDLEYMKALITRHEVAALVIGLPINMDGSEGPRCQSVRQFAANVAGAIDLPITFWDERLSTAAVTRTLLEADASRARRQELVDKMAAAYILQGALDRLRARQADTPE